MLSQPCFTPLCVPQGYSWNVTLEKVERKLKAGIKLVLQISTIFFYMYLSLSVIYSLEIFSKIFFKNYLNLRNRSLYRNFSF